jgi:hypothetical protein
LYAPDALFTHLETFKQGNIYVDLRADGIHAPHDDPKLRKALDFLLALGQERADSFRSWHVTESRSADFLQVALGQKPVGIWTSYRVEEIASDVLYQASSLTASEVPQYPAFIAFMSEYKNRPPKPEGEEALLALADEVRVRLSTTKELDLYHARNWRILKMLLAMTQPDFFQAMGQAAFSDEAFNLKFREALLKPL